MAAAGAAAAASVLLALARAAAAARVAAVEHMLTHGQGCRQHRHSSSTQKAALRVIETLLRAIDALLWRRQ